MAWSESLQIPSKVNTYSRLIVRHHLIKAWRIIGGSFGPNRFQEVFVLGWMPCCSGKEVNYFLACSTLLGTVPSFAAKGQGIFEMGSRLVQVAHGLGQKAKQAVGR